jgi:hypothetical protein
MILGGTSTNDAADGLVIQVQPIGTATAYTLTCRFNFTAAPLTKFENAGMCLMDSATGKMACLAIAYNGTSYSFGSTPLLQHIYRNSPTSFNSSLYAQSYLSGMSRDGLYHFRIQNDGTHMNYYVSGDSGKKWILITQTTNTNFLTPNQYGFFVAPYDNEIAISVVDYTVTTP